MRADICQVQLSDRITITLGQALIAALLLVLAVSGFTYALVSRGRPHAIAQPRYVAPVAPAPAPPARLQPQSETDDETAQIYLRNAIPAAEIYYLDATGKPANSYLGLTSAALQREAPGVSPDVQAVVLNHGGGYCLSDREPAGHSYYYVGGEPGSISLPAHVIARGRCPRR